MSDNYWTENKLHISREMSPDIAVEYHPTTNNFSVSLESYEGPYDSEKVTRTTYLSGHYINSFLDFFKEHFKDPKHPERELFCNWCGKGEENQYGKHVHNFYGYNTLCQDCQNNLITFAQKVHKEGLHKIATYQCYDGEMTSSYDEPNPNGVTT